MIPKICRFHFVVSSTVPWMRSSKPSRTAPRSVHSSPTTPAPGGGAGAAGLDGLPAELRWRFGRRAARDASQDDCKEGWRDELTHHGRRVEACASSGGGHVVGWRARCPPPIGPRFRLVALLARSSFECIPAEAATCFRRSRWCRLGAPLGAGPVTVARLRAMLRARSERTTRQWRCAP